MKMIIAILVALIFVSVIVLVNIDYSNMKQEDAIDSVAIYRREVVGLNVELTKALNLQQCYHEELIRVVFECYPDCLYTIPCNGRKVVVR